MAAPAAWRQTLMGIAGVELRLRRAGEGPPLLLLHHDIGSLDRLPFYDALAERFDVLLPEHPGYGHSERPVWMRSVRDLAVVYRWLLAELDVARPTLLGLGFGGWIAAEMAVMNQRRLRRLVLVGAMGIKPSEGEIVDQMVIDYDVYAETGCADNDAFVRVFGESKLPQIKFSLHTNYCDIGFAFDATTRRAVIVSCLDNLLKGAAGHAVQNMNLMFGYNEREGLQ